MTAIQIIGIAALILIIKSALNLGTGYYWKTYFTTLAKILNTTVEYPFLSLPLIMKINGRYKNRKVNCIFNALFFSPTAIRIAMTPLRDLPSQPVFMVSYPKPTKNTVRQGNEIAYVINTGAVKLKEYTETDITGILNELTEATEKSEQPGV